MTSAFPVIIQLLRQQQLRHNKYKAGFAITYHSDLPLLFNFHSAPREFSDFIDLAGFYYSNGAGLLILSDVNRVILIFSVTRVNSILLVHDVKFLFFFCTFFYILLYRLQCQLYLYLDHKLLINKLTRKKNQTICHVFV